MNIEKFFDLDLIVVSIVFALYLNKQINIIKYATNIRDDPQVKATPTVVKIANDNILKAKKKGIYSAISFGIVIMILFTLRGFMV